MPLPAIILPGYLAKSSDYLQLEKDLNHKGIPTITVPIRKIDWLPTIGGRSIIPILRLIDQTVKETLTKYNISSLNLIGHSAGGWIARIYLGEIPYTIHGDVTESEGVWKAHNYVSTLITLGTPHVSQERWTKRNLDFVKNNYPGAYYPDVNYVCVAGKAIYGEKNFKGWFTYNSYKLTCGKGECWGDGITPVNSALLEGATNITIDDVMHAPNSPVKWYGSESVLEYWINYLQ